VHSHPDKDLARCLQCDRVIQVDWCQSRIERKAAFRAERGFAPRSVPDFPAIVGDRADGIPRLTGFPRAPVPVEGQATRCAAARGYGGRAACEAVLYRKLVMLVDTVPIEGSLEDLASACAARTLHELMRPARRPLGSRRPQTAAVDPGCQA